MAFNDPLTFSFGADSQSLTRIDFARGQSEYSQTSDTDRVTAIIRSNATKPDANGVVNHRHTVSVRQVVFATETDPEYVRQASFTLVRPDGDSVAEAKEVALGMISMITDSNLDKLANYES